MIAVILSGHGGFASGLAKAVFQVIGEQPQFKFIDFPEEATTPQLEVSCARRLMKLILAKVLFS